MTVRLRETDGRPAVAHVRIAPGLEEAWRTDLLETDPAEDWARSPLDVRDGAAVVELTPFSTVTLAARVAGSGGETVADAASGSTASGHGPAGQVAPEPVQPVYSRYWLHGKGVAPAGNVPVAVHFTPPRVTLGPEPAARLRLTVACGPEPSSGEARLVLPEGLIAEIDGAPTGVETSLRYDLSANGFTSWEIQVQAAPGATGGRYFVIGGIRDASGNVLEDAALVTIGEAGGPDRDLPPEELFFRMMSDTQALAEETGLEIVDDGLELPPGGRGRLRVRVTSNLASALHGEVQLISPFGTWETTTPWAQAVTLAPGEETTLGFDVSVPSTTPPGWESWLLVKLMYFGRVRYSQAVRLAVNVSGG